MSAAHVATLSTLSTFKYHFSRIGPIYCLIKRIIRPSVCVIKISEWELL